MTAPSASTEEFLSDRRLEGALGAMPDRPEALRALISLMRDAHEPMALWWGEERTGLFNGSWAELLGAKAETALGEAGEAILPRDWSDMARRADAVFHSGRGEWLHDRLLDRDPDDPARSQYYTISLNAVRADGPIQAVAAIACETTQAIVRGRRLETQVRLAGALARADTLDSVSVQAVKALTADRIEFPEAAIYLDAPGDEPLELAAGSRELIDDPAGDAPDAALDAVLDGAVKDVAALPLLDPVAGARLGVLAVRVRPSLRRDEAFREHLTAAAEEISVSLAAVRASAGRGAAIAAFRHRIQNNLQMMSALLTLKEDGEAGADPRALFHDRLSYAGAVQGALSGLDPERVTTAPLLASLVEELDALLPQTGVKLSGQPADAPLSDAKANAVGIFITENARTLDDASPGGTLLVELHREADGRMRLRTVHDRPLPNPYVLRLSETLEVFARQLRGELIAEAEEQGRSYSLIFSPGR